MFYEINNLLKFEELILLIKILLEYKLVIFFLEKKMIIILLEILGMFFTILVGYIRLKNICFIVIFELF